MAARLDFSGLELLDAALAQGRGAILVAPHLGGWDFGGAWLASLGYRIMTVVEVVEPRELLGFIVALRERPRSQLLL